ncbi:MAG: alcohol dehydrogenase catalytic domain-containing protein [Planctomycetota bacterium]
MVCSISENKCGWRRLQNSTTLLPDHAEVQVLCVGLCRTDLFVADGTMPVAQPRVSGHEMVGCVMNVNAPQHRSWIGKTVVVDPAPHFLNDACTIAFHSLFALTLNCYG